MLSSNRVISNWVLCLIWRAPNRQNQFQNELNFLQGRLGQAFGGSPRTETQPRKGSGLGFSTVGYTASILARALCSTSTKVQKVAP
jgi:hypothetical protein